MYRGARRVFLLNLVLVLVSGSGGSARAAGPEARLAASGAGAKGAASGGASARDDRSAERARGQAVGKKAARPAARKSRARKARPSARPTRPVVTLFHINHRETVRLRLGPGQPPVPVVRRVSRLLRCHHTNKGRRIHPRLTRLLYETGRHFPGHRVEVVSGYRHPSVSRNPGSLHMKGEACDLRVSGVDNARLRDFLRQSFDKIGVGYYPNSSFVHLDVRPGGRAFWVDYSGPGENAIYARQPTEAMGAGARGARTTIDPGWAFVSDETPRAPGGVPGNSDDHGPAASGQD